MCILAVKPKANNDVNIKKKHRERGDKHILEH